MCSDMSDVDNPDGEEESVITGLLLDGETEGSSYETATDGGGDRDEDGDMLGLLDKDIVGSKDGRLESAEGKRLGRDDSSREGLDEGL